MSDKEIACSAVIFDLDGTLVDSTDCVERVWKRWADENKVPFENIMAVSHGRPAIYTMKELLPGQDVETMAKDFLEAEINETEGLKTIRGSVDFLKQIPDNLMSIATSCNYPLAKARILNSGLEIPVNMITADDVKNGKPDPESFLKAADLLRVPIEDCVIFEDSIMGVRAAVASGAKVIGMKTVFDESELPGIEFAINDFTELKISVNKNEIKITKLD